MDFKALDAATDYRRLFLASFGGELKGDGREVYAVPPMRPEEKLAEQRFSFCTRTGRWKDHKSGDQGNMMTLLKNYGPSNWRSLWIDTCPGAAAVFGHPKESSPSTTTRASKDSFDLPTDLVPESGVSTSIFARVAKAAEAGNATPSKRVREAVKQAKRTFAEQVEHGLKKHSEEDALPFAEAWSVRPELFPAYGAWCFTHDRGALAGKPQLHFPMIDPASGLTVGIKHRGVEPIYKLGGDLLKSKNEKGSSIGLWPWPKSYGEKPLLLVEGEKDAVVAISELGDRFDVVANLGGASTFKSSWVEAIQERWKEIYVCYDADAAGQKGARKAANLLRGGERSVHVVSIPVVGADVFDLLRTTEGGRAMLDEALASASPLAEANESEVDDAIRARCEDEDLRKDGLKLANLLYSLMEDNGALFYQDGASRGYCSWRKKVYRVSPNNSNWVVMISKLTGFMPSSSMGGQVFNNLSHLVIDQGKPVEAGRWTYSDGGAMYMPLYDDEQRMVRITPEKIEIVSNGYDDVVFLPNDIEEIQFIPDQVYDHETAEEMYADLWEHTNCTTKWKEMTSALVRSFFMYDFMQTHPIIRFKGIAGSGKSTAQQFMSIMLYDDHNLLGGLTQASIHRQAMARPVLLIDDLEDKDVEKDSWMQKFFLRAAMGGKRVIAQSNNDTDVVEQGVHCWIVTSGIHSIANDNPALNERLIVIPVKGDKGTRFAPIPFFKKISANRHTLWNYMFREVQRMLHLLRDGALERVIESLPEDQRPRLHEAYGMMALARGCESEADHMVLEWLNSASKGESTAVVESSHVSELLYYLPSFLGNGVEGTEHFGAKGFDYKVSQDNGLWTALIPRAQLHAIFSKMSRDTGLKYDGSGGTRRLTSELMSLQQASSNEAFNIEAKGSTRFGSLVTRPWLIEIDVSAIRQIHAGVAPRDTQEPSDSDIPF